MQLIYYTHAVKEAVVVMIKDFYNEHREMINSRSEFYINESQAVDSLMHWLEQSELLLIHDDQVVVGFVRIRFGGTKSAWLEDLYIKKEYIGKHYATLALTLLDDMMKDKQILALFVDVIPRNPAAIRLYQKCGFDHLNMIQLRKNYDKTLDKREQAALLGFDFKVY